MKAKTGPSYQSNLENYTQKYVKALGYEIMCHDKSLPGTPDIVLADKRVAVLVFGCFFHAHGAGCADSHVPTKRRSYWEEKFAQTKARDQRDIERLTALGYRVAVVWGCALRCGQPQRLMAALEDFIEGDLAHQELGNLELSWLSASRRSRSARK